MQVHIHPLVIISIADHHARKAVEEENYDPNNQQRVLGAVFGIQTDQAVEILSSVEIEYELNDEKQIYFSDELFSEDTDLYKQIYPTHECLGWYSTAPGLYDNDINCHKLFTDYNESPLYLRMSPVMSRDEKSLPVSVYQQQLQVINDAPVQVLVEIPFKVVAEPSERLTIDHIVQDKDEPTRGSQIVPTLATLDGAVESLQERVQFIIQYLDDVEKGNVPMNQKLLRDIQAICTRLPTVQGDEFQDAFFTELSNAMVITQLGLMAKAIGQVNNTMDLFETMMEGRNSGMPRGARGGMGAFGLGGMLGGFPRLLG